MSKKFLRATRILKSSNLSSTSKLLGANLQCDAWVYPVIPKGAFAGKTYASKFDNKKPSLCRVYVMGANGELVHKDWQKS